MNTTKFRRSRTDKVLLGVAGGLGEYFNLDPVIMRLAFVLLIFASGAGILLYVVLAIITPKQEAGLTQASNQQSTPSETTEAGGGHEASKGGENAAPSVGSPDQERRRNTIALGLMVLGALFLCANIFGSWAFNWWFDWWFNWGTIWPLLLILAGAWVLTKRVKRS